MRKTFKFLITVLIFAAFFVACDDNNDDKDNIMIFKAMLKGSSEVPSNESTATGNTILTFNAVTKKFNAVTTYSGLEPTGGHIHMAAVGENGGVVYPFGDNLSSPITFQSGVLTEDQVTALISEMLYINLHTEEFPGGEIRGQLMKQ